MLKRVWAIPFALLLVLCLWPEPARAQEVMTDVVMVEIDGVAREVTVSFTMTGVVSVAVAPVTTPTKTPTTERAGVANRNANLRGGPGTSFAVVGSVTQGQELSIVDENPAGDWYELADGAWIAAFLVDDVTGGVTVATATSTQRASAVAPTATPIPPTATAIPTVEPDEEEPVGMGLAVSIVIVENRSTNEILGLRNDGMATLNIGGWRLDGSKGDDFCVIPGGVSIKAGEMYHVATGDSQPPAPGYKCGDKTIWNNNGETIFLRMHEGSLVDEVVTRG